MKILCKIVFLILLLCFNYTAFSQEVFFPEDSVQVVNFRLIDAKTSEPVGLAHLLNYSRGIGSISDMLGYVTIRVGVGDSIRISAIGYYSRGLYSWGQYKKDSLFYTIKLLPKVYELQPVTISRFTTYDRFLRQVASLRLMPTKEELLQLRVETYLSNAIKRMDLKTLPQTSGGIIFGQDWYSRQKEKLKEYLQKEKERNVVEQKYNPGIVQELTGLSGNELYDFWGYLNFDEEFLKNSSDYEIRRAILAKYNLYKKKKE
ncbi:MAG TPA: hypothetical protein PLA24_09800 [Tenuifilaceae bacterium]|nr:hypothetical protein [Tenuifilaceae bacterium]HRX30273.1 hypothetical protein [Tenuifilaceae bacterium]